MCDDCDYRLRATKIRTRCSYLRAREPQWKARKAATPNISPYPVRGATSVTTACLMWRMRLWRPGFTEEVTGTEHTNFAIPYNELAASLPPDEGGGYQFATDAASRVHLA